MALRSTAFALAFLALSWSLAYAIGGSFECEELPVELCAFAVSSSGARCVLEKNVIGGGNFLYECQTSIVMADEISEWIETDDCVDACGLERMSVGISTDALVERQFTKTLCSSKCQRNCHNVLDLYTKIAAGEGVYLPSICKALINDSSRRFMLASEGSSRRFILASEGVPGQSFAAAPSSGLSFAPAPST